MPQRKTVLVIDDDPDVISTVRAILETEGYEVVSAMTHAEGIDSFREHAPDLVLCDMMMETIDEGMKVATEMRKLDQDVPIHLVSSIGTELTEHKDIRELGFNGVIQKPIAASTLLSAVERALGTG